MKPSFRKTKSIILVDNKELLVDTKESYDLILSPKYYWAKKENLPVKYTYQARSYAPASFDGVVPEGEYKYLAQKADEGFWLYAYDEKSIIDELKELGLKVSQIRKVYFSQVEFKNMPKPIEINAQEVLANHGGNIIKVPKQMVQEYMSFEEFMGEHTMSKFSINLNQFGHLIDFKKMLVVSIALFLLIILYGVHYSWLSGEEKKLKVRQEEIQKRYKMPATSMQTDALIRQFDRKATAQLALREKFYNITRAPLIQKEYFSFISHENKGFSMGLVLSDKSRIATIEGYLKKYFKIKSVKPEGANVDFEVQYD